MKQTVDEEEGLRREQARRVMPLIGGLLDALEDLPNDTRQDMEEEAPHLFQYLRLIVEAVENEGMR